MKKVQIMYYAGAAISLLVGLWHFTVPWMFGWASYIPYETLVVPINYVNLCLPFLCWRCFAVFILSRCWHRTDAASGRVKLGSEKKSPWKT